VPLYHDDGGSRFILTLISGSIHDVTYEKMVFVINCIINLNLDKVICVCTSWAYKGNPLKSKFLKCYVQKLVHIHKISH